MRIAVLLSGGVDSVAAAILMKKAGCEVTAFTMVNWDQAVAEKAERLARVMGIEHRVLDLRDDFEKKIIDYFVKTYENAATPNPCVECNRYLKFGVLMEHILQMGFEKVATGHYARVKWERGRYVLKKGVDRNKDQSYFLYGLKQEQLASIAFPLGEMTKQEVLKLAGPYFPIEPYKESQEICFIGHDYRDFLSGRVSCQPGSIVDMEGNILGTHHGLPFYTIGQRKGLGISAGRPLYVIAMDAAENRLVVGGESYLYKSELTAINNNFIYQRALEKPIRVKAKVRYAAPEAEALIEPQGEQILLRFDKAQRAITPGQSVVYYLGDYVLGGGIIA